MEYVNVLRILVREQLGLDANERILLKKVELPDISEVVVAFLEQHGSGRAR
ncbi:MAG: hypothetical protein ACLP7Q_13500 [Isosphaeraceae bacterium]